MASALEVGARRRHLHHRERLDQIGIEMQRHAGDGEILERARGLDAVIGVGWHLLDAKEIALRTGSGSGVLLVDVWAAWPVGLRIETVIRQWACPRPSSDDVAKLKESSDY